MSADATTAPAAIAVSDRGRRVQFSFADLIRYHGHGSPGGVAHAYKVLERALPLLEPAGAAERREITIATAFGGPGARDGFELVTRAVTEGRYTVDASLARPDRGPTLERFVFALAYRDREVTLLLRDGFVTAQFIELARLPRRSPHQERLLDRLKREMSERVMSSAAVGVYDVAAAPKPARRPSPSADD